jgi:hypothetical protein
VRWWSRASFRHVMNLMIIGAVVGVWLWTRNDQLLLIMLPIVLQWMLYPIPAPQPVAGSLDELVASWRERIGRFWEDEATRRGERDVDGNLAPSRWRRSSAAKWAREYLPVEGDTNDLIRLYVQRPFRMLLLGEPGSGKTAFCVQLVRALAKDAAAPRLPVLLQLASWNREDDLDAWVVEQLRTTHGIGRRQAQDLLATRRLLLILDGLDEGVDQSLDQTLLKLTASQLIGDRPFVLTCREHVFVAARVDHLLSRDAEIRIAPLTSGEIVDVLEQNFDGRPAWNEVTERLRSEPTGPLAVALNTRLMLFIMIRVLTQSGPPPDELLNSPELSSAERIRQYLIGRFLDRAMVEARHRSFHNPERNGKWLRYLANHLSNSADGRLSWWRFFEVLRGSRTFVASRVAVGAIITAGLSAILFGLFGHPFVGLLFGAAIGGIGGAMMRPPPIPAPKALPRALRIDEGPRPSLVAGLITGIGGAAAIGFLYRDVLIGLAVGSAIGTGLGLSRRLLTRPSADTRVLGPREVLRDDRQSVVRGFFLGALVIGLVGAGLGLVGRASSLGLVIPITNRLQEMLVGAAIAALCGAVTLAMIMQANSAWGGFVLTKLILASRGDVPLRLMTFLEDAERVGILRRLGPQYEFRSDLFRTYLTAEPTRRPRPRSG